MAALNFPNSPSLNDTYSANGKTWTWNGGAWEVNTSTASKFLTVGVRVGTATTIVVASTQFSVIGRTATVSIPV